jgi:cellulose synthase/poly-beta-1,6-N-acetylglucosamine synthase-like glycosyltransferase
LPYQVRARLPAFLAPLWIIWRIFKYGIQLMQTAIGTISVVIALYNKQDYIEATIRSVFAQTQPPDEIVIADDGSTDESVARIHALGDPRVRIVRTERAGSGPSIARNTAIQAAQGTWIAILDADDLWEPDYIETMAECLQQTPAAICAFASWLVASADTVVQEPCGPAVGVERTFNLPDFLELWTKMRYCPMWTSAVIARRQALLDIGGFPEDYWRGEDKDTWLRLLSYGVATYCPRPLARYNLAVIGQVTTHFAAGDHPATLTAVQMRKDSADRRTQQLLSKLCNLLIWQYARQAVSAQTAIPASYIRLFTPALDPIRYAIVASIWLTQKLKLRGVR